MMLSLTAIFLLLFVIGEAKKTNYPTPRPTSQSPTVPFGDLQTGLLFHLNDGDEGFVYGADPNALVVNDVLYVFCSHDPPTASKKTKFTGMKEYVLFTYESNAWVNHGVILRPEVDFPHITAFKNQLMFAPGVLFNQEDGYFYLYFPYLKKAAAQSKLGIAKSKTPHVRESWEFVGLPGITLFDPALFKDPQTNKLYLYGNTHLPGDRGFQAKFLGGELKSNFTGLAAANNKMTRFNRNLITEAVFTFYREGTYYLIARRQQGTKIDSLVYWKMTSPLQAIAANKPKSKIFTPNQFDCPAHGSAVEFRNKWYLFYHTGAENQGNRWKRTTCVDEIHFAENGDIVPMTFSCKVQARP